MPINELEYVSCAICGENEGKLLIEAKNTHGSYLISDDRFKLVKCKSCGFVYINPRPARKEINKYYNFNYYVSGLGTVIERLLSHYFLTRKKNIIRHFKHTGKILDIGCGNGSFISTFSSNTSWKAYGIEPNPAGYDLSKQKIKDNIFNKELLECKFADTYFDIITMWHVFEHVYEPNDLLQEINRILESSGILIIGIPNIKSVGFRIGKQNWFHLDAPRHLYHYDRSTIKKVLNNNGFSVLRIIYPFAEYPLDLYHSIINSLQKNKFVKISLILPLLIISLVLKLVFSLLKISETMIVICKKGI